MPQILQRCTKWCAKHSWQGQEEQFSYSRNKLCQTRSAPLSGALYCHVLDNCPPPLLVRDVTYGWSLATHAGRMVARRARARPVAGAAQLVHLWRHGGASPADAQDVKNLSTCYKTTL